MFSYIDPGVARLLVERGLLRHVDREGCTLAGRADQPHLTLLGPVPLPVDVAGEERDFRWYAFVRRAELGLIEEVATRVRSSDTRDLVPLLSTYMQVSSLLLYGEFEAADSPVVRVHSCCMTSDVLGSRRCECGPQLHASLERIVTEGVGALVYLSSHEGRGIGLWAKAVTYLLQDMGHDTYQANVALGLPEDSRDFTDAAAVLRAFRPAGAPIRLLTNNPRKVAALAGAGVPVAEAVPLVVGFGRHNLDYMRAKQKHGHAIPPDALGGGTGTASDDG